MAADRISELEEQIAYLSQEKRSMLNAVEMVSNLIDFGGSLNRITEADSILASGADRLQTLIPFELLGFYLVDESTSEFSLRWCSRDEERLNTELDSLIEDGTFSWALGRNRATFASALDGRNQVMLHPLATPSRVRGMFAGLTPETKERISDVNILLFSATMLSVANALESFELYHQLRRRNADLSRDVEQLQQQRETLQDEVSRRAVEAQEQERRFRMAAAAGSVGLFDWDLRRQDLALDDNFRHLLGLPDGIRGRAINDWKDIVHDDDWELLNNAMLSFVRNDEEQFVAELRLRRSDGEYRWFLVKGTPDPVGHGRRRIVGTATDITDRKRIAEEKERLTTQLLQSQKMEAIGTLAGGIAHDFNNILGAIMGFADLALEDSGEDRSAAETIEEILKAARRAKDLVQQILTFSRQDSENMSSVDLASLARESVRMLESSVPPGVSLSLVNNSGDAVVKANAVQIQQVVLNLLTNASHATEEAARTRQGPTQERPFIQVEISDVRRDEVPALSRLEAPSFVVLTVRDSGTGMHQHTLKRIFDPFFTTKPQGKGTGMGLAVVHGIVSAHDGHIAVESTLGKGTEFRIYLPSAEPEDGQGTAPDTALPHGDEFVMIIDDEAPLTEIQVRILRRLGYRVSAFTNPRTALTSFLEEVPRPDLIIVDQQMPELSGTELVEEIREAGYTTPVIMSTGFSEYIDADSRTTYGISAVLLKPVIRGDLARKVREVLDRTSGAGTKGDTT